MPQIFWGKWIESDIHHRNAVEPAGNTHGPMTQNLHGAKSAAKAESMIVDGPCPYSHIGPSAFGMIESSPNVVQFANNGYQLGTPVG